MSQPRKRKYRSLRITPRAERREISTAEFVMTLSVPGGEILKLEVLDKSGNRRPISESEFAELAGEAEHDDFPLEDAYVAGFSDATDDVFGSDDGNDEEDEIERFLLREIMGSRTPRHGLRHSVLRRLLRRDVKRRPAPVTSKPRRESARPAAHKDGHDGNKEGG